MIAQFSRGLSILSDNPLYLEITPVEERPLYLAFNNSLFGPARFTGMISGLIVDWVGFTVLLIVSIVCYSTALFLSLTMAEPRTLEHGWLNSGPNALP